MDIQSRWEDWEHAWRAGLAADRWFPVGDPGDSPYLAVRKQGWQVLGTKGGAVVARDGERLLYVTGEDWPIAVNVLDVV